MCALDILQANQDEALHKDGHQSRMPLRTVAGNEAGVAVRLNMDELPFDSGSLDLVLLPHVLEFETVIHKYETWSQPSDEPEQLFRGVRGEDNTMNTFESSPPVIQLPQTSRNQRRQAFSAVLYSIPHSSTLE